MFTVNVSLASTAEYSSNAAESIKDLNPNAADILITSVITSMVTDLAVSYTHLTLPTICSV